MLFIINDNDIDNIKLYKTNVKDLVNDKLDILGKLILNRFIKPIKTELTDVEKAVISVFNDIENIKPIYTPNNERELIICIKNAIPYIGNDGNFNWIDTSKLTSLAGVFRQMDQFNGDITNWDVSNVKNMAYTFQGAKSFKRDLSNWDVHNVVHMMGMFLNANYPYKDLVKSWIKKYNIKFTLNAI